MIFKLHCAFSLQFWRSLLRVITPGIILAGTLRIELRPDRLGSYLSCGTQRLKRCFLTNSGLAARLGGSLALHEIVS